MRRVTGVVTLEYTRIVKASKSSTSTDLGDLDLKPA